MFHNNKVAALENQLAGAKDQIELAKSIARLTANKDFRKVIVDIFSTKECARYVQESADPALTPAQRADALAMAQAAGHLRRWLSIQLQLAETSQAQLDELGDMIADARAEEEAEGTDEGEVA